MVILNDGTGSKSAIQQMHQWLFFMHFLSSGLTRSSCIPIIFQLNSAVSEYLPGHLLAGKSHIECSGKLETEESMLHLAISSSGWFNFVI